MKMFRFDAEVGKTIDKFDSVNAAISRVVRTEEGVHIGCIHLKKGGVVGYHPAVVPQLFLVVQGDGWVRADGTERVPIKAGQAAFWKAGEGHESGTESGMTAIVIEAERLDPAAYMPEIELGT
jgi:quercetin dioxygenase-like cupin family protein